MQTFKDNRGREWSLDVTVSTVKNVKTSTGVLLTKLFDDNFKLYADLAEDVVLFTSVLWCMVDGQNPGTTADDFDAAISGDSFRDSLAALGRAVADFFPDQQQRQAMTELLLTAETASKMVRTMAVEKIAALDPQSLANGYMNFVSSGPESAA